MAYTAPAIIPATKAKASRRTVAAVATAPLGQQFVGPTAYLFLLPGTLLFAVFVAYPILWVMGQSLLAQDPTHGEQFVGLTNYLTVFTDPVFWIVVRNMILWGAITIPVQMLIGGTIAWFIERHTERWRGFFRTMFFL